MPESSKAAQAAKAAKCKEDAETAEALQATEALAISPPIAKVTDPKVYLAINKWNAERILLNHHIGVVTYEPEAKRLERWRPVPVTKWFQEVYHGYEDIGRHSKETMWYYTGVLKVNIDQPEGKMIDDVVDLHHNATAILCFTLMNFGKEWSLKKPKEQPATWRCAAIAFKYWNDQDMVQLISDMDRKENFDPAKIWKSWARFAKNYSVIPKPADDQYYFQRQRFVEAKRAFEILEGADLTMKWPDEAVKECLQGWKRSETI